MWTRSNALTIGNVLDAQEATSGERPSRRIIRMTERQNRMKAT
jgi:hypothetical protein